MRSIAGKVSLIFLLSFLLFSCAKKEEIKRAEVEPYTGQVTVEALKQSIGLRYAKSLKALLDVTVYKNGEQEGSFNGVLGYKSPGLLRTSFFGPFGLTVMDMLVSKDLLQMYVPPKNTLYESESPDISFSSLFDNKFRYVMEEEGDMFVLAAYRQNNGNPGPAARCFFDRTYLLNRSIVIYKDGLDFAKIDFGDFNGRIPERIDIYFRNGVAMDFSLKETELDTDIPDDYFKVIDHEDKKVRPFQDILKRFDPSR